MKTIIILAHSPEELCLRTQAHVGIGEAAEGFPAGKFLCTHGEGHCGDEHRDQRKRAQSSYLSDQLPTPGYCSDSFSSGDRILVHDLDLRSDPTASLRSPQATTRARATHVALCRPPRSVAQT